MFFNVLYVIVLSLFVIGILMLVVGVYKAREGQESPAKGFEFKGEKPSEGVQGTPDEAFLHDLKSESIKF